MVRDVSCKQLSIITEASIVLPSLYVSKRGSAWRGSIPAPGIPFIHRIDETGISISFQFWIFSFFNIQFPLPAYGVRIPRKKSCSAVVLCAAEIQFKIARYFWSLSLCCCLLSCANFSNLSCSYCWIWASTAWLLLCDSSKCESCACSTISCLCSLRLSSSPLNFAPKSFQIDRNNCRQTSATRCQMQFSRTIKLRLTFPPKHAYRFLMKLEDIGIYEGKNADHMRFGTE